MNKICKFHSRPDQYGNSYHAARIYRTSDARSIAGLDPCQSAEYNIRRMLEKIDPDSRYNEIATDTEIPIRQFDRMTKDWPRLPDTPEELQALFDAPRE